MGTVAVARENVQEWLQPTPLTVIGVAAVVLDNPADVVVEGLASAGLVPDCLGAVVVPALGDGTVAPFGDVQFFPRPVALAEVVFDNTASSDDVNLTAGIAFADIRAFSVLDAVSVSGEAGVLVLTEADLAVAAVGDAEVSFGYFGDGDYPIFPFRLPLQFIGDPQNIQDAAAYVSASGFGELDSVSVFAEALPVFTGDVVLTRQGSTPIFPFALPAVFDAPANILFGSATLEFQMDSECAVDVIGESAVPITGDGISYGSAVFPWTFPVALVAA